MKTLSWNPNNPNNAHNEYSQLINFSSTCLKLHNSFTISMSNLHVKYRSDEEIRLKFIRLYSSLKSE